MTRTTRNNLTLLTLGLVLSIAGCSGHQTRADAKNAAQERWGSARANISYSLAEQQFEVGDLDKAEKTVNEAISTHPDDPRYYDLSARIAMERGQLERAYRLLEHSISLDEERHESHYLHGVVQQRWQRYEPALESYEQAFAHRPDEPAALLAVAEMLVKLDRVDEAVERLEERLAYFANNAAIRTGIGRIHMMKHNYAKAVTAFREASVLSPEDQNIRELLALAAFADEQYGEVIRLLAGMLSDDANKDRVDLKIVLADAFMATENPVEARRIFLSITQEDPNDVNAWIKLAQASWMVGDDPRLTQATARVIALAPRRHEGYLLRGMAEHRKGEADAAIASFERASELAPSNTLPLILKGMTKEQAGDSDGAVAAYRAALAIEPDDRRAQELLAGVAE
ncbi:MAG: tetratricopeptide repeat protein [Phycisphaeraceae bacterium]